MSSDSEIIRKAVELADGWYYHDGDCSMLALTEWFIGCELPQWALDSLAAQLVRQVDALKMAHIVITQAQSTVMWPGNGAHAMGEGRTMNTLRAIVESGVLDG